MLTNESSMLEFLKMLMGKNQSYEYNPSGFSFHFESIPYWRCWGAPGETLASGSREGAVPETPLGAESPGQHFPGKTLNRARI